MKKLVLGIDGGGTETELILADSEGNILKRKKAGPASLRNTGLEKSCKNVLDGVRDTLPAKEGEVVSTFVGFPAFAEEYKDKKQKLEEILSKEIPGAVKVGSDQLVAFRSGTDSSEGVVVIAGTGGVIRGFKGEMDAKTSGWGYLADEGSAFWTGLEVYRKITKQLDGREEKTPVTEMAFEEFKVDGEDEFNKKIYENPMKTIPRLSIIADYAERKGDKAARRILAEAAEELAFSVKIVVEELGFENEFPLILIGGMFKSRFLEDKFSEEVESFTEKAKIKKPEKGSAFGAVKLAIEHYENQ